MSEGMKLAEELFSEISGVKARNVELGHGSFITMDFGKDVLITSKKTMRTRRRGEWFLWIYMCAWRLDHKGQPVVGASDRRDFIESKLPHLEGKKFLHMKITSNSFDCRLEFDENWSLLLFSHGVQEDEQWMFFTSHNGKVFTAGPGISWEYEDSSKPQ